MRVNPSEIRAERIKYRSRELLAAMSAANPLQCEDPGTPPTASLCSLVL